jgi:hypothetical protein
MNDAAASEREAVRVEAGEGCGMASGRGFVGVCHLPNRKCFLVNKRAHF